jgi:hypothetical protein
VGEPLPLYYRENYFSDDTLFYTEQTVDRFGVAGEPVPNAVRNDNVVTLILIICFVVFVISTGHTREFVGRQLKRLFHSQTSENDFKETSGELGFQFFLLFMSCLLMAVTMYGFTSYVLGDTLIIDSELLMLAIFLAVFMGYQFLHWVGYTVVNHVFFAPQQNSRWIKTQLFLKASMGALLFPVVMLSVYFNLSIEKAVYYFGFVLIFIKSVTFYKCWNIFFRQNGDYLQNFLYFCALEIVPLLSLGAALIILIEHLKLNF